MKNRSTIASLSAAFLMVAAAGCATEQREEAALLAQAKVSRAQAEQVALASAPGGTITEADLENDYGHVIWSFDLITPGSKILTEVNVDAITGYVISVATETPQDEAKEK